MNTYRKKNFRNKRGYAGRPHRRPLDNFHQPLPPEKEKVPYARHTLTKGDVEAVVEALLSGTLTQGKESERFEALLAKLTHSEYAIALSSGTAAVHAALACLKLEPGDEVITSTLNFSCVVNMIKLVGATPVLVDCDPRTLTISVEATAKAITENTKAIFANNFAGHPPDLYALRELCDQHSLYLLEDACHGLGGKYRGHYVGNQADITCFSFHPSKAVTTAEGGAVTTGKRHIADWIRLFRTHGIQKDPRYFKHAENMPAYHQELQFPGMNYRLSELHAALGRSQLTRLDRHIERRRSIAQVYYQKLGSIQELKLPYVADWADHAFHIYPVQLGDSLADKRDLIFNDLHENGIETQVHYIPVHRMPCYAGVLGDASRFPNAENYFKRCITLPLYPDLSYKELERITDILIKLLQKHNSSVKTQQDDKGEERELLETGTAAGMDFRDGAEALSAFDDRYEESDSFDHFESEGGDFDEDDDSYDEEDDRAQDTDHEGSSLDKGREVHEVHAPVSSLSRAGGRLRKVPKAAAPVEAKEEESSSRGPRRYGRGRGWSNRGGGNPGEAPAEAQVGGGSNESAPSAPRRGRPRRIKNDGEGDGDKE